MTRYRIVCADGRRTTTSSIGIVAKIHAAFLTACPFLSCGPHRVEEVPDDE
jgi:hypothetical protein